MDDTSIFIGISGGSGAGKSWLARRVQTEFPSQITNQDWYDRDLSNLPYDEAKKTNFDLPSAIENTLIYQHLKLLKQGYEVQAPGYCYSNYHRLANATLLSPKPLIIFEGIFALYWLNIRSLLHRKLYIRVDPEIRFSRRLIRDSQERDYSEEHIQESWAKNALPMHDEFVEPTAKYANIVWDPQTDSAFENWFLADLRKRLAKNGSKSK